ncbi:glycosyltransferase family 4 protein [Vibrio hangzhouensis]|uniref:glycosyltransferase family 4 protein n=1 Tax=Vibrio hangzhouensis TaxID=462991 RepID=UPI001C987BC5|nr:glycosyltransferase family 1 protein [Vibrio hangzhouensis]MBY6198496.1 glycosyltransferase family 4 protein [Vibrio hangzhouensis]
MKIGIDARPLSHELTGIGRYTYNVLLNLIELYPDVEWFLYSDRPLLMEFDYPNVRLRTGKSARSLTSTIFSQSIFPFWAIKDKLNTFWSPRHHLPLLLFFMKNIHKVVTIHDIVWIRHPKTMSRFGLILEKLLFPMSVKIADTIITVSEFTKSELIGEFSSTYNKTYPIPLQSFIKDLDIINKPPRPIEDSYILFVGTLEPRKNLENLLRAFRIVLKNNGDLKLVIVGKDGWGDTKISDLVKELGLEEYIIITGFVSDKELLSLYMHCDTLAMPSLYEGFGLPALEALSLKRKVVVSQKNAIAEIKGDNVFITDLDDKSIANTLERALSHCPINYANVNNDWAMIADSTFNKLKPEV